MDVITSHAIIACWPIIMGATLGIMLGGPGITDVTHGGIGVWHAIIAVGEISIAVARVCIAG